MAKILIVEDDRELSESLGMLLTMNGFNVEYAYNSADGLQMLTNFQYDVAILDWHLPDGIGLNVCKKHRMNGGTTLILFLTGVSDIDSKTDGLDSGADDYLTKPFQPKELLARVRTLLRRPKGLLQDDKVVAGISLDSKMRTLSRADKTITLSRLECQIVDHLLQHRNQIFTSKALFDAVWPSDTDSNEQSVRVHVRGIRKKLEEGGFEDFIQSAAGGGWFIAG
jgi:OmpR-family two-component system manganese-sensing response regulator